MAAPSGPAADGHHDLVGQPHTEDEGPMADAEHAAARLSSVGRPLGAIGKRFNHHSLS